MTFHALPTDHFPSVWQCLTIARNYITVGAPTLTVIDCAGVRQMPSQICEVLNSAGRLGFQDRARQWAERSEKEATTKRMHSAGHTLNSKEISLRIKVRRA